jgi:hypothetical protein
VQIKTFNSKIKMKAVGKRGEKSLEEKKKNIRKK